MKLDEGFTVYLIFIFWFQKMHAEQKQLNYFYSTNMSSIEDELAYNIVLRNP